MKAQIRNDHIQIKRFLWSEDVLVTISDPLCLEIVQQGNLDGVPIFGPMHIFVRF